jgi:hypothetical protein
MVYENVQSNAELPKVLVEYLPDDRTKVILTKDNTQDEEGAFTCSMAEFFLPEDREETEESIEESFEAWWKYAEAEGEDIASTEERIEALEEAVDTIITMLIDG